MCNESDVTEQQTQLQQLLNAAEKIASSSKVVASSHAVKKSQPKVLSSQQVPPQPSQHTRLKSDELTTKRIKEVVAL